MAHVSVYGKAKRNVSRPSHVGRTLVSGADKNSNFSRTAVTSDTRSLARKSATNRTLTYWNVREASATQQAWHPLPSAGKLMVLSGCQGTDRSTGFLPDCQGVPDLRSELMPAEQQWTKISHNLTIQAGYALDGNRNTMGRARPERLQWLKIIHWRRR